MGHERCRRHIAAGRYRTVFVRYVPDGRGPEKGRRQPPGAGALQAEQHTAEGRAAGHRRHRCDPVLLRHLCDGGGLRQLRYDEGQAGHRRDHGRHTGHQRHRVDPVSVFPGGRQRRGAAAEHRGAHRHRGRGRHHPADVHRQDQQPLCGRDPAGLRRADVRHVLHVRRGVAPAGERSLYPHPDQLLQPHFRYSGGSGVHQRFAERLRRGGYFAGAGHYRRCHL